MAWDDLPLRYQANLLLRFHWREPGVCLRSLLYRQDPFEVIRERQKQRFAQFGGDQMNDAAWERWCNEMPIREFMAVMLSCGASEEEEGNDEKRPIGFVHFSDREDN